jgi:hypothetical protein
MHGANLVLHCGAHHVEREQVTATPTPARTPSRVPIAHGTLQARRARWRERLSGLT